MVRKAVDPRINVLIKNNVQTNHRSFFVVVGDHGKEQVANIHWMLSQAKDTKRPSVLWCYKKELGFTSHRKKREAKVKKEIKRGIREPNSENPFELFISVTDIRYTYYKESHKILGNTYGMCVLQDFEALTPNLLARTIETVEGGGIIVLLLRTMSSLKQLYTLTMDIHSKYRTAACNDIVPRFNERFLLSIGSCTDCLVVDDELNVLPVSAGRDLMALPADFTDEKIQKNRKALRQIKESQKETQQLGPVVNVARTLDQAKAIVSFNEALASKTLRQTVALTAARGRGKSAVLGLAIAAAVGHGYSNIFVTSPAPENLKTLFEFVMKGFDALGYEEHIDYDIIQSTKEEWGGVVVRVNIFKSHRQTIQYIDPADSAVLGQAELLVIDEAAAIPLPIVRSLLGPYLVFMASTVNGYEGTGRSLTLKLIKELRERGVKHIDNATGKSTVGTTSLAGMGRTLKELSLDESIRYAPGDKIENWLNRLLCLDASLAASSAAAAEIVSQGAPHPSQCQLYVVNRDALFSYHPVSEAFLQKMIALYTASHYKNSPNDLILMSDAPAHRLFVLLPPIDPTSTRLPEPLCVVQVCLEGSISRQSIKASLGRGQRADGDLIPWLVALQFQDDEFASLSGARIVRIATHPDFSRMGYGSRAVELLAKFYSGSIQNISMGSSDTEPRQYGSSLTSDDGDSSRFEKSKKDANGDLRTEVIKIKDASKLPSLLLNLDEVRRPQLLDWIGVSYGITLPLHKFWKRAGLSPMYLRQTANDITGEHTCVMLKPLVASENLRDQAGSGAEWLSAFATDFRKRFLSLLSYQFRAFDTILAASILDAAGNAIDAASLSTTTLDYERLSYHFSGHDLKRLEQYANNMLDYHVVLDLLPAVAGVYFSRFLPEVSLSSVQSSILLALGLQHKSVEMIEVGN